MATPTGLEPATSAVTGRRSNQLSYGALGVSGNRAPNGIRTRATALKGRRPGPLDDGGSGVSRQEPAQHKGRARSNANPGARRVAGRGAGHGGAEPCPVCSGSGLLLPFAAGASRREIDASDVPRPPSVISSYAVSRCVVESKYRTLHSSGVGFS